MAKNPTLNRSKFLLQVAERTGAHRRDVEHIWENALAVIQDNIRKGTDISISGFGKFKQRVRKAAIRTNPQTGEKIKVPAAKLPRFLPAKQFKQYVGGQLKALPSVATRPVALSVGNGAAKAAPKKAAVKKTVKKAAPKKAAAKKTAKKPAKKAGARKR